MAELDPFTEMAQQSQGGVMPPLPSAAMPAPESNPFLEYARSAYQQNPDLLTGATERPPPRDQPGVRLAQTIAGLRNASRPFSQQYAEWIAPRVPGGFLYDIAANYFHS